MQPRTSAAALVHGRRKKPSSRLLNPAHYALISKKALEHATSKGRLKIITGRAGTGKSYAIGAIREAFKKSGFNVIGLAPTNIVAQDMADDGFETARTVHNELFRLKNIASYNLSEKDILIVDEAAMLDSTTLRQIMSNAFEGKAKIILVGDDRQLLSVGRGGMFGELVKRFKAVEISKVVRQKVAWQRDAAQSLSRGRFQDAVQAFADNNAITFAEDHDDLFGAIQSQWCADYRERPQASRFVFAFTNKDVDRLKRLHTGCTAPYEGAERARYDAFHR